MKLILLLLRSSWQVVLLASLVGGVSGIASMSLIAIIHHSLRQADASTTLMTAFIGICVVVLLTRVSSKLLLTRLSQNTISRLRMKLCRRIVDSPLVNLENIGSARMLASLTGDVAVITQTMNSVPVLCVNIVILLCGAVYLGWMSPGLLVGALTVAAIGVSSYLYGTRWARIYLKRGREAQDDVLKNIRFLIEGIKELKTHRDRRTEFIDEVLESAVAEVRRNQVIGFSLQGVSVIWGRFVAFVAIGLMLFAWPKIQDVDAATLTGYTLTILYLMSPLERIVAWLPLMSRATISMDKIRELGIMLEKEEPETGLLRAVETWERIELCGVTHVYRDEEEEHRFLLGPINLTLSPGEIVFVVGGNGSGKTTLAKIITGLYVPDDGEICLDGEPIAAENRESYRQLFSAVFDDPTLFDSLLGMDCADLDRRARDYLELLELDHVVSVEDGVFSTTRLSRGQRKRLALVTAYLEDRPFYLFDEWAADQDPVFKRTFYLKLLPELKEQGKSVLAITHDDRYFACADRVVKLEDGKAVQVPQRELPQEVATDKL